MTRLTVTLDAFVSFYKRTSLIARIIVLLLLCTILSSITFLTRSPASPVKQEALPLISLQSPHIDSVDVHVDALGTVTPSQSISLKSQVDGVINRIHFEEGQIIKKGDRLIEIESAPFKAQLMQYEGQLERDLALLHTAKLDLKRYETLLSHDAISNQVYETQKSLVKQYEGVVQSDKALVASARINYNYCFIDAPASGKIGLRHVDAGNFIRAQDTSGFAVINTLDPIAVVFSIPEDTLSKLMIAQTQKNTLEVNIFDRSGGNHLARSRVLRLDNQIDTATGTLKLKGEFSNSQNALFPNQFVAVRLKIDTLNHAILIPSQAVQYSAEGPYVYCFNAQNHTVHQRKVIVGPEKDEHSVILQGLESDDRVVFEGIDKLSEGTKVRLETTASQNHASIPMAPAKSLS
ncbi:MAG: efflux RND transporter periplasmic adaptor subunit [Alphaproteobacteria bacterium]|nr:efflux RND transporter periplasmic adaptor subunit [Alphaproteobacteria bacterium]